MAKPTIGADFAKKEIVVDDTTVTLQIWDTAGQERFQSLGYAFYRGADCCCLVYDITNAKSFESLAKWKQTFLDNAAPNDPSNFPFFLLGNKIDMESSRAIQKDKVTQWCKSSGDIPHLETSAKEAQNVEEAFHDMARKAMKQSSENRIFMPDSLAKAGGTVRLSSKVNNEPVKKKKCKC